MPIQDWIQDRFVSDQHNLDSLVGGRDRTRYQRFGSVVAPHGVECDQRQDFRLSVDLDDLSPLVLTAVGAGPVWQLG
jgi:hypothetical protein